MADARWCTDTISSATARASERSLPVRWGAIVTSASAACLSAEAPPATALTGAVVILAEVEVGDAADQGEPAYTFVQRLAQQRLEWS